MPEFKFPEVKLPEFRLPEGLRDMTREDIQKAMSDLKMPDVRVPTRSEIAKNVENALPTRPGPSPVPFALLAMLGGLIVGWILATSPATGPRISAAMDGVRQKIDDWRSGADLDDELDGEHDAFQDAFRSPASAETPSGSLGSDGVGVGPGRHPEKAATAGGASVGVEGIAADRV